MNKTNTEAEIKKYSRQMAKVAAKYRKQGDHEWAERTVQAAARVVEQMRAG